MLTIDIHILHTWLIVPYRLFGVQRMDVASMETTLHEYYIVSINYKAVYLV